MKRTLSALLLLIAVLAQSGLSQSKKLSPSLASLVEAERAFARTSVEKGIRASFLEFFADDGINFTPHPTKTRESLSKQPAPASKPPVTLNWEPVYADISQAGDLGYTTGPYTFTDQGPQTRPPNYGFYFSVWKKQPDGTWKVVIDCGIDTPDHSRLTFGLKPARQIKYLNRNGAGDHERERTALLDVDRMFLKTAQSVGAVNGYLKYLSGDARLHRNGKLPLLGREEIKSFLLKWKPSISWDPIGGDLSQSNDLGYTYGSYEFTSPTNKAEKGYYVRVWKRDASGAWKMVLDSFNPIPAETK